MTSVRFTVVDKIVRFFATRQDAVNTANGMTKSSYCQHVATFIPDKGWLIFNAVLRYFLDVDGKLPYDVNRALCFASKKRV